MRALAAPPRSAPPPPPPPGYPGYPPAGFPPPGYPYPYGPYAQPYPAAQQAALVAPPKRGRVVGNVVAAGVIALLCTFLLEGFLYDGIGLARSPLEPGLGVSLGLLIAGAVLYGQQANARAWRGVAAGLGAAGIALLGAGSYLFLEAFHRVLPFTEELRSLLILAAALAMGLHLLRSAAASGTGRGPSAVRFLTESSGRLVWLAITVAGYLLFRPSIQKGVEHLELYEYGLGLAIAGFVFARAKGYLKQRAPERAWASPHVSHRQHVKALYDRRYAEVEGVVTAWIERGEAKDRYFDIVLRNLAVERAADERVAEVKNSLQEYEDLAPPRLAGGRRLRALARENRKRRLNLHKSILIQIRGDAT